jgi:hypothetical protein
VVDRFFDAPGNIGEGTRDHAGAEPHPAARSIGRARRPAAYLARVERLGGRGPVTRQTRRISGQHPYDWEMRFSQDLPRWRSTYGLEAYGSFQETYYRINEVRRTEYDTFWMAFAEYKATDTLSLRGEMQNFTGRENRNIRVLYDGPRDTGLVEGVESRSRAFSPLVHLRVRKTLG